MGDGTQGCVGFGSRRMGKSRVKGPIVQAPGAGVNVGLPSNMAGAGVDVT